MSSVHLGHQRNFFICSTSSFSQRRQHELNPDFTFESHSSPAVFFVLGQERSALGQLPPTSPPLEHGSTTLNMSLLRLSLNAARVQCRALAWPAPRAYQVTRLLSVASPVRKGQKIIRKTPTARNPRHVPSRTALLSFNLRPQEAFASAVANDQNKNRGMSLERFYLIYSAFHKAAVRACQTHSPTWEQDFMTGTSCPDFPRRFQSKDLTLPVLQKRMGYPCASCKMSVSLRAPPSQ